MRTAADIDRGINDELVAARVFADMGFIPSKPRPGARITKRAGCDDSAVMLPPTLSEPEKLDREMEQRGGLLRAIEPEPGSIRLATLEELNIVQGGQGRSPHDIAFNAVAIAALAWIVIAAIVACVLIGGGS